MLRVKNLLNLGNQQSYKISKILQNAHIMLKDIESNTTYLYNYIEWN